MFAANRPERPAQAELHAAPLFRRASVGSVRRNEIRRTFHPVSAVCFGEIEGRIITQRGRLRDSLSLITVELMPLLTPFTGNWDDIREYWPQILEPCILGDKDAILPALGPTGGSETLVIVASIDEHGATVVERRTSIEAIPGHACSTAAATPHPCKSKGCASKHEFAKRERGGPG